MTAPGNASKITDIPLVKTRVVIGWIPVSVLFPGCEGGELGGEDGDSVGRVLYSRPTYTDCSHSDLRVWFI